MRINPIIYDVLIKNHIITTTDVLRMGFSRMILSKYVKEGLLERCRQGVYTLPEEIQDDMYIMALSSKYIVFSHDTAAFLNGISERTPFEHSITIPSNSSLPKVIAGQCHCYYIKEELYSLGLTQRHNTFGHIVQCYNSERTICDLLRSRSRVDQEMIVSTIKNYAQCEDRNLNRLAHYAKLFHVSQRVNQYMEVLL